MNTREKEKPSEKRQWRERSRAPVAIRPMTGDEIEEHRRNLVASYQCEDSDITTEFQKIYDENDEDRDDCLFLKYYMKCVVAGKPVVREIFTVKLPIPEELRRMAEQMRQQRAKRTGVARPQRAGAPPTQLQAIAGPIIEEPESPPTAKNPDSLDQSPAEPSVPRPKLKRSTKKK